MKQYLKNVYSRLIFMDITINKDKAWFCNLFFSSLFEIDLKTYEIKLLSFLPADNTYKFNSYVGIAYFEGKLIIAPRNEHRIIIFNISTNSIEREIEVDLSCMEKKENVFNLFSNIIIIDNYAYLLPGRYPRIIKLNLIDYSIELIRTRYLEDADAVSDRNRVIINSSNRMGNHILLSFWQRGRILDYNTQNNDFKLINVPDCNDGIGSIDIVGNDIYISNVENSNIYKLNEEKFQNWKNINLEKGFVKDGIRAICKVENELIVFPIKAKAIASVDLTSGELKESRECLDKIIDKQKYVKYVDTNFICTKSFNNERLLAYSLYEGNLLIYTGKQQKWEEIELKLPEQYDDMVEPFVQPLYMKELLREEGYGQLKDWLEYVIDDKFQY